MKVLGICKLTLNSLMSALLLALSFFAEAQQPKKVVRIGYLSALDPTTASTSTDGIRRALRDLGYIEGQNITIEYRYAAGNRDQFAEVAAELVRLKVDIILVGGDRMTLAAKNATRTIPIVMTGAGADPVKAGLVESLARPAGNVTGLTDFTRELSGKRLELLKEAVPKLARVAILYERSNPNNALEIKEILPPVARALKLTLQPKEVPSIEDLDQVFATLHQQPLNGVYVLGGPLLRASERRIAEFALKSRIPSMINYRETVDAGGLMYYGADQADGYRRVAIYIDKILKGGKPAELPVEQPNKFELVINLKTANQIGLTIPQKVLARADKVIK